VLMQWSKPHGSIRRCSISVGRRNEGRRPGPIGKGS
jgi:hypothetical protein